MPRWSNGEVVTNFKRSNQDAAVPLSEGLLGSRYAKVNIIRGMDGLENGRIAACPT